jgi:hypothetical protein
VVDLFSRIYEKENELIRAGMVHLLSGVVPLYVVNEFPKSGGTWVGQMLGRALGVPFPRNRFPMLRSSVMHGHYLDPWGMKNVVVPWRDGRDVMVSWYHQQLIPHEYNQRHAGTQDGDGAGVDVRVHQVEPLFPYKNPESPREGDADAPFDKPVEQRPDRYVRLLEQVGETAGDGAGNRHLVPLAHERYRQVHDVPLCTPDLEGVYDEQRPKGARW